MTLEFFGYISAFLSIVMVLPYIRDILLRTTKPERASWLIWTVLGFIAFFSQLAKGASHSLWLTGGQTVAVLVVLGLSLRYGVGGLSRRDILALAVASLGLALWYLTSEPLWALGLVIFVDSIGTLLTALKAYKDPSSETMSTWFLSGTSGIFGSFAVGEMNGALLAYPLYIVVANYLIVAAMCVGKYRNAR
jgi:hypothetical protein